MKKELLTFLSIVTIILSCTELKQAPEQESKIELDKDSVALEFIEEVESPESKFKGQFVFDENKMDKANEPYTREEVRNSKIRNSTLRNLDFTMTFFGNGKGINLADDGSHYYQYATKKEVESARFDYEYRNDSELWVKPNGAGEYNKLFTVIDFGVNLDYFEIQISGLDYTLGLYKVGEYNANSK